MDPGKNVDEKDRETSTVEVKHKETIDKEPTNEQKSGKTKKTILPVKILIPVAAVVIIIAVFLVLYHPAAKSITTPVSVPYTGVNAFSVGDINSLVGGSWAVYINETANSSVIAANPLSFPPGTLDALLQIFTPVGANISSKSTPEFMAEAMYLNSSSNAASVFSNIETHISAQFSNISTVSLKNMTIGSSKVLFLSGYLNETNSSSNKTSHTLIHFSETYSFNNRTLMINELNNGNFNSSSASSLVSHAFS